MRPSQAEYQAQYYQQHKADLLERSREYYKSHRDQWKRYRKKQVYMYSPPSPTKRFHDLAYRFRKRFGGLRETIIQRDNEMCQLCGITRDEHMDEYGRDIVVDHIDGNGRSSKTPNNNPSNLRVLCLVCNLKVARKSSN